MQGGMLVTGKKYVKPLLEKSKLQQVSAIVILSQVSKIEQSLDFTKYRNSFQYQAILTSGLLGGN